MTSSRRSLACCASLVCWLAAGHCLAVTCDFAKDDVTAFFATASARLCKKEGAQVVLPARGQPESRPLPIEPGKKYRLTVRGAVDGEFVVEENDRAHILALQSPDFRLTGTYAIRFLDSGGKPLDGAGKKDVVAGFFLTNEIRPYVMVFYAPPDARSAIMVFQGNERVVRVAGVELDDASDEACVNPNPDFRYGELNYSGWRPARDGRLYTRPDGKTVLNSGYGGASPLFPVAPNALYLVTAIGQTDANGNVTLAFQDRQGKEIERRFLLRAAEKGTEARFQTPKEAAFAKFVVYSSVLESIRVVPGETRK